jgi:hypothetical protein
LAQASAEGNFESAEQGLGTNRALEQEDVAQRLAQLAQAFAFRSDAAADGEQDEGEI